jgi:hypothetical protein
MIKPASASSVQKPDFSGRWLLNPQACTLTPLVAAEVEGGELRMVHHEPVVSAHLTIMTRGKPFNATFEARVGRS